MRKHKIFIIAGITLSIVVLVISLSLYWQYNLYKSKNAFYFSYKNHESLDKQTDAFADSVTVKDMKRAGIESSSNDGSKLVVAFYDGKYQFMPRNTDNSYSFDTPLVVGFENNDEIFHYYKGFKKTGGDKVSLQDKKEALKAYKEVLKKTYDHWQIKYKFPFAND